MATDPLWIDNSAGAPSYSGADLRLNGVVPFMTGVGASLGVRSGIRASGSGTDLLVQQQTVAAMSVKVNPGAAVIQGAISTTQGAYAWSLDTVTTVTIASAHATLARTDRVCIRIRDANVDTSGQRDGAVMVITGTAGGGVPSLPTDATYVELARIAVGAAVTSILTANITDKRQYTSAAGGIILCDSNTEPSASSVPLHQITYRSDLDMFRRTTGTAWRAAMPYRQVQAISSSTASITFSGIPTSLRMLRLTYSAKSDVNGTVTNLFLRVNGLSTNIYYGQKHETANATVATSNFATQPWAEIGTVPGMSGGVGTTYATGVVDIAGWDGTSTDYDRVTWIARNHCYPTAALSRLSHYGGIATTNPPWTSLSLHLFSGSFAAGSHFLLDGWD